MKSKILLCLSLLTISLSAKEGAVECGNLIYAGTRTSQCFSDEFLTTVQQKTSIATERRFKAVKLVDDELFKIPFVIMTGTGDFSLTSKERVNLKQYLENGGFLLASASCSNEAWSQAFEREVKSIFGNDKLQDIPLSHEIFRTIFEVKDLKLSHSGPETPLRGMTHNGKVVLVYSSEGLNDTSHTEGCCCCGGNEIQNSMEINANILAYALLH
ncbi:DUF4159 domain-containing protein [Luteolibacter pohnpeiensis]|uniref:DUF4159 domain-containing protein n=1 Tax=Luteolibacter pohnpeiensis TaxID=454153 RepID=A0A934S8J9_9BACT|nr:DUF4159 domain-containing protein [Luteolibacter pohnpeiensis]MBK1881667.1 DUF4159 domain-containing protein [Luteolibacter pohnpeiensis]